MSQSQQSLVKAPKQSSAYTSLSSQAGACDDATAGGDILEALKETFLRDRSSRIRPPGYTYLKSGDVHEEIDAFGRRVKGGYSDHTIASVSGRIVPLVVQCADEVLSGSGGATWQRKSVNSVGPITLRLANWAFGGSMDIEGTVHNDKPPPSQSATALVALRAFTLIPLMPAFGTFFSPSAGQHVNFGKYDSVPYRYYGRPKKSRNEIDNTFLGDGYAASGSAVSTQGLKSTIGSAHYLAGSPSSSVARKPRQRLERVLLPRLLCFLNQEPNVRTDNATGNEILEYQATNVQEWMMATGENCPEYLVIAWITDHFPEHDDRVKLHEMAREATRQAGLSCYWISENCVSKDSPDKTAFDIWRISDVIRSCKELVVVIRAPQGPSETVETVLTEWAASMWTLPELLLSPGREFKTYYSKMDDFSDSQGRTIIQTIPKNHFPARCLPSDKARYQVRRLLDHYDGNLKMSELELLTVALSCFSSMKPGSTGEQFLPGDPSYALMGLLGRRPNINASDSGFLAFARLSLENYNDRLFERLLCLLPASADQPWHDLDDAYGAKLWDIYPTVQVSAIGEYKDGDGDLDDDAVFETEFFANPGAPASTWVDPRSVRSVDDGPGHFEDVSMDGNDGPGHPEDDFIDGQTICDTDAPPASHSRLEDDDVVVLDGCFAAKVHWDGFRRVWHAKRLSKSRLALQWMLRVNFIPFFAGIASLIGYDLWAQQYRHYQAAFEDSQETPAAFEDSPETQALLAFALIFFFYGVTVYWAAPHIIRHVCRGKIWDIQAWFFGFEGYIPIDEIERNIFGDNRGRLSWSSHAASPLSYQKTEGRWAIPCDPSLNPETKRLIQKARDAGPGELRIFTIVDTYSMSVTLFEARRPPEVLLVCGSEGGMQRALGCSFEWTTSTFYKETVLRLDTRVLGRMERIRKVRLGLRRNEKDTVKVRAPVGETGAY